MKALTTHITSIDESDITYWPDLNSKEFEEFLEEHPRIEAYSRDGMSQYLVIERSFFSMGGAPFPTAVDDMLQKFPNIDSVHSVMNPGGHSGFIWRRVLWVKFKWKQGPVEEKQVLLRPEQWERVTVE